MNFKECRDIFFDYMNQKSSFLMDTRVKDQKEFIVNTYNTDLSIKKDANNIEIASNTFVHPAIYIYKGSDFIVADINLFNLINYLNENGCGQLLTVNDKFAEYIENSFKDKHIKWQRSYIKLPYNEISYVSDYKKILICNNEIKIENSIIPDIQIEAAKYLIEQWEKNLNNYLDEKIKNNFQLMPHITAGIDTRILTHFWRNRDVSGVYCKKIKTWTSKTFDGDIGQEIIDKIKPNLPIYQEKFVKKKIRIDLDGKYSEPFRRQGENKEKFIYNFVNIFGAERIMDSSNVFPFLHTDILSIENKEENVLHTILLLTYCPDLLDIPFHSFVDRGTYTYESLPISRAKDVINFWNSIK